MTNDDLLLNSLTSFYNKKENSTELLRILNNQKNVSLRSIDWFITNYSKKNNINYSIYKSPENKLTFNSEYPFHLNLNVFQSYKAQLKAYSKKKFDPFCRRDRIQFNSCGEIIETTIGQLNFFKWAICNLITDYILLHKNKIELDMNTCLKNMKLNGSLMKKNGERKRRQELSLSATRGLSRNNICITLDFN